MSDTFFTVSQLNNVIKGSVNACFPHLVWVCGEIQGYDRNKNKNHIFFDLVEKAKSFKNIKAKIGLVIFEGNKVSIMAKLQSVEKNFVLRDDIEVKFACRLDFYPPHGAMRLIVENVDPVYTLGRVAQEKQKLIALLRDKGILDKNKGLMLPKVPLMIGLITSDDSAAYNDFINELEISGLGFKVVVCNTTMQGAKTEGEVCQGIDKLEKIKGMDVIVITRGGGSIADLSFFDSAKIAECISDCSVPVLSGIGHDINVAITDLAAHTFAKTPTAIAQFIVERVKMSVETMDSLWTTVVSLAQDFLLKEKESLKDKASVIQETTKFFLRSHSDSLLRMQTILKLKPSDLLKRKQEKLLFRQKSLISHIGQGMLACKNKVAGMERLVRIMHPDNTLKRGFSITRLKSGCLMKSVDDIKENDKLITMVFDGEVSSVVETVKSKIVE